MGVIFDSIVVDPVVFYGVIAGIILSMLVIVGILLKSKNKKQDYITLEPIIIEDKEEKSILSEEKQSSILDVKNETKEKMIYEKVAEPVDLSNIVSTMEKDIVGNKQTVTANFETDQEEQAVISYKELLKIKEKVEPEIEKLNIEIEELSPQVEEAVKKFKNSEFISPVFGRAEPPRHEELIEIKKEPEIKHAPRPVNNESLAGEDFLNSLRSFRKNLD